MGKGTRKPSDMNAPKRPLSAYMQWANKARPALVKAHPSWAVTKIMAQLGKDWKKTSSSERTAFQAKYEKAKAAYDKKFAAYKNSKNYKNFEMQKLAFKIHETKKPYRADPNAPKRPLSAYMLYAGSVRAEIVSANPDMANSEIMKEQGVWWKALSEAERAPWVAKAAKAAAKHQKLVAKYQNSRDYQTYQAEKAAYKANMLARRNKLMGVKSKRARSESAPKKAKKAKRSRRSASRRSARRARTPKAPKSSATSGSEASTKKSRSRKGKRRARRRARAPRSSKRSSSRSTKRSSRRARTPKSSKR